MPSNKDKNKSHELDETLKRLGQHSGVMGTIVVNSEGIKLTEIMILIFICLFLQRRDRRQTYINKFNISK